MHTKYIKKTRSFKNFVCKCFFVCEGLGYLSSEETGTKMKKEDRWNGQKAYTLTRIHSEVFVYAKMFTSLLILTFIITLSLKYNDAEKKKRTAIKLFFQQSQQIYSKKLKKDKSTYQH